LRVKKRKKSWTRGQKRQEIKHRAYREGPSIGHPNNRTNGWIAAFDFEKKKLEKFKVFTLNDKNIRPEFFVISFFNRGKSIFHGLSL
jgi:hypothetical protein